MKVYLCDACKKVIECPHDVKMKEFYIGVTYDFEYGIPSYKMTTRKEKVHLCDECYHSLNKLAERKKT